MKLLLLGSASVGTIDIIEKSHELGHDVIVTDNSGHTKAKLIADKVLNISTADLDQLELYCRENRIDGVLSGVSSFNWIQAIKLSNRLGLNTFGSLFTWNIFNDKKEFNKIARKYDIPVTLLYDSAETINEFPVIVKPVDNCGARGIGICYDSVQLKKAINDAMLFSQKKDVIIEKYYKGQEVSIYGTVINGKFICSGVIDRHTICEKDMFAPKATILYYPSPFWDIFQKKYQNNFENFFNSLQINFGLFFFQGVVIEDELYIYEGEMRLSASSLYNIIDYYQGYNRIELMIRNALGESIDNEIVHKRDNDRYGCVITPLLKPGTIQFIEDRDLIDKPWVIKYDKYANIDDVISMFDKSGVSNFACIHVVADSMDELNERIKYVRENLIVVDNRGNSLIII